MTAILARLTILAACLAMTLAASAAEPQLPTGHWQSPPSGTYTNPALTGAEFFLDIDVASDGSFRGVWGQYFCTAYPGAYGISIYSCSRMGSKRASGRFGPGGGGVIELDKLGRSAFSWSTPRAGELAIDLPKNWQGEEQILYRARMTRDGKIKPATAGPGSDDGTVLSAVALYREFKQNSDAALARYRGKTLELEGRRGALIEMSDGGAAIHIPDGFTARALVLIFADPNEVRGIAEGAKFRFKCTLTGFDYQYVQMDSCAIVR
jgi:hypothetical protein